MCPSFVSAFSTTCLLPELKRHLRYQCAASLAFSKRHASDTQGPRSNISPGIGRRSPPAMPRAQNAPVRAVFWPQLRSQRVFDKLRQVFDVAADLVALAPLQTRHLLLLVLESSAGSRDVGQGALDCLWKLRRFRPAMECPRDLRFGQRRILDNTNLERRTALTNRSWVSWIITGW